MLTIIWGCSGKFYYYGQYGLQARFLYLYEFAIQIFESSIEMSDRNSQENNASAQNQNDNQFTMSRPVPPTLLRIYADNQDKRSLCIFWAVFFITLIVMTILSTALPDQLLYIKYPEIFEEQSQLKNCTNAANFINGQLKCLEGNSKTLGLPLLNMDPKNQFAVITVELYLKDSTITTQINDTVMLKYITIQRSTHNDDQVYYKRIGESDSNNTNFTFHSQDASKIYAEDNKQVIGYSYPIWVMRQFQNKSYVLVMDFTKPLGTFDNVKNVQVSGFTVNPEFTIYTIVIRYFFFAWSLVGTILYLMRYCKIPKNYTIPEQKMVVVLAVLLIFFNDPLYPVTVLTGSKGASYFSVFFVMTFVIYLLFFWILMLDRIFYQDGTKKTQLLTWKRILYIIVTYILTIVLYTEYAFDNIQGMPIVPAQDLFATRFVALQIICLILVVIGFVYIFIQYARICSQVDAKLWRNQLFMFFSIFFIFITIVMFFVNGFHVFTYTGNRILLLFTEMNMYTYYMLYMYSLTPEERERIVRGQLDDDGHAFQYNDKQLLAGNSDKDYVDLEFSEMPSGMMDNNNRAKKNRVEANYEDDNDSAQIKTNEQLMKNDGSDDEQQYDAKPKKKQQQKSKKSIGKNDEKQGDFGDFDLQ